MSSDSNVIEPIKTPYKLNFLNDQQLGSLQEATLSILEDTGVQFPSKKFSLYGVLIGSIT